MCTISSEEDIEITKIQVLEKQKVMSNPCNSFLNNVEMKQNYVRKQKKKFKNLP